MNAFHVLTILPVPVLPEIQHYLNILYFMSMVDVTFLTGQTV